MRPHLIKSIHRDKHLTLLRLARFVLFHCTAPCSQPSPKHRTKYPHLGKQHAYSARLHPPAEQVDNPVGLHTTREPATPILQKDAPHVKIITTILTTTVTSPAPHLLPSHPPTLKLQQLGSCNLKPHPSTSGFQHTVLNPMPQIPNPKSEISPPHLPPVLSRGAEVRRCGGAPERRCRGAEVQR